MRDKRNVDLYIDKELVEKSKSLGFNLEKKENKKLKLRPVIFSSVF